MESRNRFPTQSDQEVAMVSPGDIVVYRHHVCKVAAVREAYFEGRDYFELHALFENSSRASWPSPTAVTQ